MSKNTMLDLKALLAGDYLNVGNAENLLELAQNAIEIAYKEMTSSF